MKKQNYLSVSGSILSTVLIFAFVLAPLGVFGASTIGTNMSTTGTFLVNPAADSATSVRFQNAAGTNYFVADSTNSRIGVGAAPSTTFEVQGTASASYFFTKNTIQVGGTFASGASVSYSRFGMGTTGHSLTDVDDVLFSGLVEFDDNAFFDAKASVSGNFQTSGRFVADTAASHSFAGDVRVTSSFVVGSTVASASGYVAEFVAPTTATVAILFGGSTASSKGTCFQMKDAAGGWRYVRILGGGTSFTINGTKCH